MKKELGLAAGISPSLIAKLGRNENVTVEVLVKICAVLNCTLDDIMEIVQTIDESKNEELKNERY